jgi:hypothetical protein
MIPTFDRSLEIPAHRVGTGHRPQLEGMIGDLYRCGRFSGGLGYGSTRPNNAARSKGITVLADDAVTIVLVGWLKMLRDVPVRRPFNPGRSAFAATVDPEAMAQTEIG